MKTGQLFVGSKFTGVASTATAYGGTGLPPCPAYDFSSALSGTLAWTVEPGEKGTPPNFKEPPAAAAANVEKTFSATKIWLTMSNLFKKLGAPSVQLFRFLNLSNRGVVSPLQDKPRRFQIRQISLRRSAWQRRRNFQFPEKDQASFWFGRRRAV